MGAKYNFSSYGVSDAYRSYGSYGSTLRILKFFADVKRYKPKRNSHREKEISTNILTNTTTKPTYKI